MLRTYHLILLFLLGYTIDSAVVEYTLVVDSFYVSVNGVSKVVVGYNYTFPGPVLRCKQGDTLQVTVFNILDSSETTVHWHGIPQKQTPWMDGVPLGTQCAIAAQDHYFYSFVPNVSGTFWYHSHFDLQRNDAAFGPLIIEPIDPLPFTYDEELILVFSDWYTAYPDVQLQEIRSAPFVWVGSPQYLLLNGELQHQINVTTGKTYLVRAIGAAALSWYNITIPGHNMTIVESQGNWITPMTVGAISLNTGERLSFLLSANNPGCYRIQISMLDRAGPSGSALLVYSDQNCSSNSTSNYTSELSSTPPLDHTSFRPLSDPVTPIPNVTRTIVMAVEQVRDPVTLGIKWTFNKVSSRLDSPTPLLFSSYYALSDLPNALIIDINEGEVIDILFHNVPRSWDGVMEQHGLHIHGHTFWLLGSGLGNDTVALTTGQATLNLVNPTTVDTFTLLKGGWVWIRFVANNPGVWLGHCHVTYHLQMGMFFFLRYPTPLIPPPGNVTYCGAATQALIDRKNQTASGTSPAEIVYVPSPGQIIYVPSPGQISYVPSPGQIDYVPSPGQIIYVPTPEQINYVPSPEKIVYVPSGASEIMCSLLSCIVIMVLVI